MLPCRLVSLYYRFLGPLFLKLRGVRCGRGVRLFGTPLVALADASSIVLGNHVVLCSDSRFTALGVNHQVILRTLASGATITIGSEAGLSGTTICAATSVSIGSECLIGANVIIADTDFHCISSDHRRHSPLTAARSKPISIGANVFVGANSIILKGVRIGSGSVIGAGSIVCCDIPNDTVAAGNPCRALYSTSDRPNLRISPTCTPLENNTSVDDDIRHQGVGRS